ncbi:MAG TPA: DUF4450 domain-containing protein [Longimicrobiaceae bacterium]|nr:DUF4450 domain-containing protein [Longimicrobiaceae bacterium]
MRGQESAVPPARGRHPGTGARALTRRPAPVSPGTRATSAALALVALALAAPAAPAQSFTSPTDGLNRAPQPMLVGTTTRPLRYHPDGGDFVIENGSEYFNRPLYDPEPATEDPQRNAAFRVDAGDRPEFSLYLPGRGGNLRLGVRTAGGARWLSGAARVVARYRPGSMLYEIHDPLLGGGVLHLTAIPVPGADGLLVRAELSGAGGPVELLMAYGGMNGDRGSRAGDIGTEDVPISRFFQLKPAYTAGDTVETHGASFVVRGRPAAVYGILPPGTETAVADAHAWSSPDSLLATAGRRTGTPVVVGRVALPDGAPVMLALVVGRGGKAPALPAADALPALFGHAEAHREEIANRVTVETPDPFVNAAAGALNVAADAVWDDAQGAVMHGAVAWRRKLLGWRGPYSLDALGWHDRARRHLSYWADQQVVTPVPDSVPPADPAARLSRDEPALHSNGALSTSHYDMNLVYVDALFRHLLWTGDLELARKEWPVLERHLAWERRLFRRPFGADGSQPLYEAYAAIWASDDLEYEGGGVTHATAYNYYHNLMAARLARLLGKDPAPYEAEAEAIRGAMRQQLWLPRRGWYAEYRDLLGLRRPHPAAGLWTVYHAIDSRAATPFEAWQLTRYVDTHLAHIPIRGPGVPDAGYYTLPTTDWMPYSWSINNVVMAEVEHTALALWQARRPEDAYRLFMGGLFDSMYLGLCPGNVGMTTYFDHARGESQRDFADAVGVVSRALVEGLFGIAPDALADTLHLRPGFPAAWDHARIDHPDLAFAFRRDGRSDRYDVEQRFDRPMTLSLEVAARGDSVASVTVDGRATAWAPVPGAVGAPRIRIDAPAAPRHTVVVTWKGAAPEAAPRPRVAVEGAPVEIPFAAARVVGLRDPQQALGRAAVAPHAVRAVATGRPGARTAFAELRQGEMSWWAPMALDERPAFELVQAPVQDDGTLAFRVVDNTASAREGTSTVHVAGRRVPVRLRVSALDTSGVIRVPAAGALPGTNPVRVDLPGGGSVEGAVVNWRLAADGVRWAPVDLAGAWNDDVTRIFRNDYLSPRSPYPSLAIPEQGIGSWTNFKKSFTVDDSGLRAAARRGGGRFVTPQGIPFETPARPGGRDVAFTSLWDNYPDSVRVALNGRASHLYLLLVGSTNWMQSRIDNAEVVVTYADGGTSRLALRNPTTWWPIDQDYYLDDYAFRRPAPIPPRVDLATGTVRVLDPVSFAGKGGPVEGGAANVLDLPLDPGKELRSLTLRTLSNEVVVGLMSATLVRP